MTLGRGFYEDMENGCMSPSTLGPPPAKKVCPDQGGEDSTPEVPALAVTCPDEGDPSISSAALSDVAGSSAAATVRGLAPLLWWRPLYQRGFRMHRTVRRLQTRRVVMLQQFLQAGRN